MIRKHTEYLNRVSLAIIFPGALSYIAHFAYSGNILYYNLERFERTHTDGIQKYRVLGREVVLVVYDLLEQANVSSFISIPVDTPDETMFLSLFIVITVGFILWSIVFYRLINKWDNDPTKLFIITCFLISMSFFRTNAFDALSYFFITAGILTFHQKSARGLILYSIIIVLGTLTREPQALVFSYAIVVAILTTKNTKRQLSKIGIGVIIYLLTYISLRLSITTAGSTSIIQSITIFSNLRSPGVVIGLFVFAVWICLTYILVSEKISNPKLPIVMLLTASSPYLLLILIAGKWNELRLVIPICITLILLYTHLGQVDEDNVAYELSSAIRTTLSSMQK